MKKSKYFNDKLIIRNSKFLFLFSAFLMLMGFSSFNASAQEFIKVYVNKPKLLTPDPSIGTLKTETFSSLPANDNNWAPMPNGYTSQVGTFYQTTGSSTSYIKNSDQYGANTGKYMSIKAGGVVTLKFDHPVRYFGFAWPAGDNDNKIKLYRNNQLLVTISTSDIKILLPKNNSKVTAIDGTQYTTSQYYGQPGTGRDGNEPFAYLNFYVSQGMAFDKVVLSQKSGSGGQFETDNFAIVTGTPTVPGEWALLYTIKPPTAVNDTAMGTVGDPVTIDVLANDVPGDNTINPSTVKIEGTNAPGDSYTVAGQGVWSVNTTSGNITFTPESGFTGNPTPIQYSVQDNKGYSSNLATVTVTYPVGPTANDDQAVAEMNHSVVIPVLDNDIPGSSPLVPSSLTLVSGTEPDGSTVGTFTVNSTTHKITFTPVNNFLGTATVQYRISDQNNLSSTATVTVNVVAGTVNYFPATGYGTLAFEDLWPYKGDYDFNDMVVAYRFKVNTNTSNYVESVQATFILKAFGASFQNGFGFQLSSAINANDLTVTGTILNESFITLNSNGTEANQSKPTIIVFDNADKLMQSPGGIGVNTTPGLPYVTPDTIRINIEFKPNTYTYNDLDIASFNPFIFVNKDRSVEVHLPDYPPTSLANLSLLGTGDDNSNPSTGRYYMTKNNLPWAINIYGQFNYPIEKQPIIDAYLKFADWANSGGIDFSDWYLDKPGYRDPGKIYVVPNP